MKEPEVKARFHLKFRTAEVLQALQRADDAENAFQRAGGFAYCHSYDDTKLAVNVKSYVWGGPPEMKKEPDDKEYTLRCQEMDDFWNFDLSHEEDEGLREGLGTDTYHFPDVNSAGRSGGQLTFSNKENKYLHERAVQMIRQDKTAEQVLADELSCYSEEYWEEESGFEVQGAIDEITHESNELALFFEDALKWLKHVVACKEYREKNLEGKHIEYLEGHVSNLRYELFDLANCTAVFDEKEDEVTVSWPQHARIFEDRATPWDCDEYTPGAQRIGCAVTIDGIIEYNPPKFRVWLPQTEPHTFSFTLKFQEFIDALSPNIPEARRLLNT